MATRTEVQEMIRHGENSGVEFKGDQLEPEKLARELVAFSNLRGGVVLLGVEDDGSVSGLRREGLEEWVMNVCRDKVRPGLIPFYEGVRDVEPGRDIALVRVPTGYDVHSVCITGATTTFGWVRKAAWLRRRNWPGCFSNGASCGRSCVPSPGQSLRTSIFVGCGITLSVCASRKSLPTTMRTAGPASS